MPKTIEAAPPITDEQREQVLRNPDWRVQWERMTKYSPRVAEEYLKVCWRIYHSPTEKLRGGNKHSPELRKNVALNPKRETLIVIKRAINFLGGSASRDQLHRYLAQSVTPIGKTKLQSHLHYLVEHEEIKKSGRRGNWTYSTDLNRHGDVQQRSASAA